MTSKTDQRIRGTDQVPPEPTLTEQQREELICAAHTLHDSTLSTPWREYELIKYVESLMGAAAPAVEDAMPRTHNCALSEVSPTVDGKCDVCGYDTRPRESRRM
jgi:hypothetical protein